MLSVSKSFYQPQNSTHINRTCNTACNSTCASIPPPGLTAITTAVQLDGFAETPPQWCADFRDQSHLIRCVPSSEARDQSETARLKQKHTEWCLLPLCIGGFIKKSQTLKWLQQAHFTSIFTQPLCFERTMLVVFLVLCYLETHCTGWIVLAFPIMVSKCGSLKDNMMTSCSQHSLLSCHSAVVPTP